VVVNHFAAAALIVFCGVAWVGIQNLGYAEFDQARRLILAGGFRQSLNSNLALRSFEQSLSDAKTLDERWTILRKALRVLGLVEVRWRLDGKVDGDELWKMNDEAGWTLRIPLAGDNYINFTRITNVDDPPLNVDALVGIIRRNFGEPFRQTGATAAATVVSRTVLKSAPPAFCGSREYVEPNVSGDLQVQLRALPDQPLTEQQP
jgi:hypothetical protein